VLPNQYADQGQGELPDIIIFAVESLRGKDVGYGLGMEGKSSATPNLDLLAEKRVVFPRLISSSNPSPSAFMAIHTGLWAHRDKLITSYFQDITFDSLPDRRRYFGYESMILRGFNPSFDNQLYWGKKWYDHLVYELPQNNLFYVRRIGDELIMDKLLELIAAHDNEDSGKPFFAFVTTAGTHEPFTLEDYLYVPFSTVKAKNQVDRSKIKDPQVRYNICLRHLDEQIGRVLKTLEQRRKKDNTVIIVIGDHADKTDERIDDKMRGMPVDSVVWTSTLIWGPEHLVGPVPRKENYPCSQVDLFPSILAMIGDNRPLAVHGVNLFADYPEDQRTAVAVSNIGYRMDKREYSLYVSKWNRDYFYLFPSFKSGLKSVDSFEGTPFSYHDVLKLYNRMEYWAYHVERNRVWDPLFLSFTTP